jgi:hypothetical protein
MPCRVKTVGIQIITQSLRFLEFVRKGCGEYTV